MKNRILVIPLALVLALSVIAVGCPPQVVDPEVPVVPKPEVIRWIAQTNLPAGDMRFIGLQRGLDLIEVATGGRLVVALHPPGGIVPSGEDLMGVHRGVLDMAMTPSILWVADLPLAVPFTMKIGGPTALEYYFWYKHGEGLSLMQEMLDDAGLNVKPIAAMTTPPEIFLYTTFPVYGTECLRGRKLRLLGDEAVIFGKMGVAAVATPAPEIYEAMRLGVIDGFQRATLGLDMGVGLHEVSDFAFVSPVRQSTDVHMFIVNKDSWAGLPDDIKVIVEQIMWATGIKIYAESSYAETKAAAKWEDFGVPVMPMPASVEDEVIRLAREFYALREAKYPFYARVMESLRAWRDAYKAVLPRL